ncbi:hypothetical protein [uncultured Succinatimonas sp.]|uniref:hypothetical protein n=1 Tax=uncultured Succinatimonas sp. TaxID=1262973 RepID=UPI00260006D6|nr:hypothetical protein [uncultured Succinatimonas sp.]
MFHPIYNADGTLSRFRIACLGVFVVCLIAYAVTVLMTPSDNVKVQEESADTEIDAATLKLRTKALSDLADGFAFLKACDSINNGFSGCTWTVSDEVGKSYAHEVKFAKESFVLALALKDKTSSDICARLILDSQGKFKAEDSSGRDITAKCFPEDFLVSPKENLKK